MLHEAYAPVGPLGEAKRGAGIAVSPPRPGGRVRIDREDFKARIDDPALDVDENLLILVLKGCGPKGYPGMPEVGNMPLPRKLLERGVKDMVRISDAHA